jgi:hypothetical protein
VNTFDAIYDKLTGGAVGNWLAIIGVLSLIYWAWRIVAALQRRHDRPRQAMGAPAAPEAFPAAPPAPQSGAPPEHIAAIAAAVHAMLGAHRLIHLEPSRSGQTWEFEGRWMQQTSHKPR